MEMVKITSVAVATMKVLFGTCILGSSSGTGDLSHVLKILHVCRQAYVRFHVSPCTKTVAVSKRSPPVS